MDVRTARMIDDDDKNKSGNVGLNKRLFVGGLGASVTEDDLIKTFSSLGKVNSLEIIRSKGRSFAYFDFLPSSDTALSKLLSTYNGCMWKGGRLKVQKAKEHYLFRLKREWAEDAKLASREAAKKADETEKAFSSVKLNKVLYPKLDKRQLKFFFPKLGKVKVIPFSGAGKHKYSFQRVNVPPLPIHFCDCEEHSYPSHTSHKAPPADHRISEDSGINKKELNIMMTVMNNLFERKNCSKSVREGVGTDKKKDKFVEAIDHLLYDENNVEHESDEDNLIINIAGNAKNKMVLSRCQGIGAQESGYQIVGVSKDNEKVTRNVHESQKKDCYGNQKRKPFLSEEDGGNETLSADSKKRKGCFQADLKETQTCLDIHARDPDTKKGQPSRNLSWSQKSSWRNLVGDKSASGFNISNLIPNIAVGDDGKEHSMSDVPDVLFSSDDDAEDENLLSNENLASQQDQSMELKKLSASDDDEEDDNLISNENLVSQQDQSVELKEPSATDDDAEGEYLLGNENLASQQEHMELKEASVSDDDAEDENLLSNENLASQQDQSKELKETSEPAVVLNRIARGASWLQKASWTQLVDNSSNCTFTISQILPITAFKKEDIPHSNTFIHPVNSTASKQNNLNKSSGSGSENQIAAQCSRTVALARKEQQSDGLNLRQRDLEEKSESLIRKASAPASVKGSDRKQLSPTDSKTSDTFLFMRSAASMKEWRKAKAALAGSRKRKDREK